MSFSHVRKHTWNMDEARICVISRMSFSHVRLYPMRVNVTLCVCVCLSLCATPTCGATLRTHQVILIWNESLNITNCRWHVEKLNPQLTKNSREYNELNKHRKITNLINHQSVTHVRGLVEKPNEQPTNTPYMTDSKYHPNITNSNESSKCHEPSRARRKTEWAAGQWFRQKSYSPNHGKITNLTSHFNVTNLRRLFKGPSERLANESSKLHKLNKSPKHHIFKRVI